MNDHVAMSINRKPSEPRRRLTLLPTIKPTSIPNIRHVKSDFKSEIEASSTRLCPF